MGDVTTEDWTQSRPFTQVTNTVIGATAAVSAFFGVGTTAQPAVPVMGRPVAITDWTQPPLSRRATEGLQTTRAGGVSVAPARAATVTSPAEQIRIVHSVSGLTWEQLARLFGVSRRAVHNWAIGGRLSSRNAEVLARVAHVLADRRQYDAEENRNWLLTPAADGVSPFDMLRQSRATVTPLDDVLSIRERLGMA